MADVLGTTTRMPEQVCPWCGVTLDAATALQGEHVPDPGDVSLCSACCSPMIFGPGLLLERITEREIRKRLGADQWRGFQRVQRAMRTMHSQKG